MASQVMMQAIPTSPTIESLTGGHMVQDWTLEGSDVNKVMSPAVQCMVPRAAEKEPAEKKEEEEGRLFTQQVEGVGSSKESGPAPSPRFGHTAIVHENSMVVFGGRNARCNNELWVYNFIAKTWRECGAEVPCGAFDKPKARAGHTAVVVNNKSMFMFGGVAEHPTTGAHSRWLNDLWVLDLKTYRWQLMRTKGGYIPTKRKGHTSVAYKNSMFIFGGGQDDLTLNNDLWEFNYVIKKWVSRRYTGHIPQERMYHVSALHENKMIIFGGRAITKNGFLNDIFEINLQRFVCRQIVASGPTPSPRMCSTAICHNGVFAVFTGGSFAYLDDSHQLDLRKMEWSKIDNFCFGGRTRPTTVRWGNTILTFGGCVEGNGYVNDYVEVHLGPLSLQQCLKRYVIENGLELNPDEFPETLINFTES
eukprot:TRINITY_DN6620_c0_g2_i1.p1 TRINITY_DN6620_c0_g2~~TRINITY_DN6620_c0_g2_i1.p1  ORF type:complete len:426 (+),score=95.80 TRINITY_DN6620_c0_g2_i1:23-1279(+)